MIVLKHSIYSKISVAEFIYIKFETSKYLNQNSKKRHFTEASLVNSYSTIKKILHSASAETYSNPCQTYNMERFPKIVNSQKSLVFSQKTPF